MPELVVSDQANFMRTLKPYTSSYTEIESCGARASQEPSSL